MDRVKQPGLLEMPLGSHCCSGKSWVSYRSCHICQTLVDIPRAPKLTLEMARRKTCSLNCFNLEAETPRFMNLDGNF